MDLQFAHTHGIAVIIQAHLQKYPLLLVAAAIALPAGRTAEA